MLRRTASFCQTQDHARCLSRLGSSTRLAECAQYLLMEGAKATPTDLLVMMSVKQIAMVRKMRQNLLSNDMHSDQFCLCER